MAFSVKSAIASTLKNRASSESGKPLRKDARVLEPLASGTKS